MYSRLNLVYKKNLDQWQNSSKSCKVIKDSDGFYKAFSYSEVIFYYDKKLKKYIFNDYKFSNTTLSHQKGLLGFLEDKIGNDPILCGKFSTLNHGLNFEVVELDSFNLPLVKKLYNEKFSKFENAIQCKNEENRKIKNKIALINKIKNFNYSTKLGFTKAMAKLNITWEEIRPVNTESILKLFGMGYSLEEIESNLKIDRSDKALFCFKNFNQFVAISYLENVDITLFVNDMSLHEYLYSIHSGKDFKKLNLEKKFFSDVEITAYLYFFKFTWNKKELDQFTDFLKILDNDLNLLDRAYSVFKEKENYVSSEIGKILINYMAAKKLADII